MHRLLVICIAALFLSATVSARIAQTEEPDFPFPGELILIGVRAAGESHACEIRTLPLDGGKDRTLFRKENADIGPGGRLSSSRDRLAFSMFSDDGAGGGGFWMLDLPGEARKFADGAGTITGLSPDGNSVAAYLPASDGQAYESFVVDVATGESTKLELPAEYVTDDWRASDGMRTAMFENSRNQLFREIKGDSYPARQLDLLTADGMRTPLTKNPSTDNIWSRFSPTGDRVAYYSRRLVEEQSLEHAVICDVDQNVSKEIFCFTTYGDERSLPWFKPAGPPAWAPDGSALAWLVDTNVVPGGQDDRLEVLLLPLDGTAPTRIRLADRGIEGVSTIEWR